MLINNNETPHYFYPQNVINIKTMKKISELTIKMMSTSNPPCLLFNLCIHWNLTGQNKLGLNLSGVSAIIDLEFV